MSSKMRVGLLAMSGALLASLFGAPPASAEGAWGATGSLHTLRGDAAVVVLQDGRVLAAGGWDYAQGSVDSAEIYDPATGTWTPTGAMHVGRRAPAAALLQDGRVLVAGGEGNTANESLASAEIFDPMAGTWQLVPPMQYDRARPSAVLLQDGRVLVVGCGSSSYSYGAPIPGEIFSPTSQTWSTTSLPAKLRADESATLLPDGRVLVVGGRQPSGDAVGAEIYDPTTDVWTPTRPMVAERAAHSATLLPDGRVLIAGGMRPDGTLEATAETFDPITNEWMSTGTLLEARYGHAAVATEDGRVTIIAGEIVPWAYVRSVETYDPASGMFSPGPPLLQTRFGHRAVRLPNGTLVVVGGNRQTCETLVADLQDSSPPVVWLTGPSNGVLLTNDVTVSALAKDDTGILRVDFYDGDSRIGYDVTSPYSMIWPATAMAHGEHILTARAYDRAYKSTTSSAVRVQVIDQTPPQVAIVTPTTGATVSGTVTITAAASDASGIDAVDFFVDSVLIASVTSPPYGVVWDAKGVSPGSHTLTARAVDSVKNSAGSAAVLVTIQDVTPPQVAITAPADGATVSGVVTTTAAASDASGIAAVHFFVDSVLVASAMSPLYSTTWDASYVSPGTHTLTARAVDRAGNSADSAPVLVTVADVSPPQVEITAPANGATVSGTVTLTAAASDASGISRVDFIVDTYPIGSVAAPPYSMSWDTSDWPLGDRVLMARAIDQFGNEASSAYVVVTLAEPSAQAVYDSQLGAPRCVAGAAVCDSGDLLVGRGPVGPEPNQPNTLSGSCSDGTAGSFHSDESLDRIKVSTVDGSPLAPGKTVKVEVTVWAWSGYADRLDLFYAADATAPQWVYMDQIAPQSTGQQTLFTTYVLPEGSLQAIRGRFSYNSGSTDPCDVGAFNDHDDLVFSVGKKQSEQAVYDSTLRAPKCSTIGPSCTSGGLLVGRGPLGPEPNGPNTTQDECADGTGGTFHVAPSIEAIRVATLDGTPMMAGQTVRVETTVWSGSTGDRLDLFYSSATSWPRWTYIGSLTPPGPNRQVLSMNYALPEGHAHAVRAVLHSGASGQPAESCGWGSEDDSDDLWFVSDSGEAKQRLRIDMVSEYGGSGTVIVISGGVAYSCADPAGCDLDVWSGETAVLTATPAPDSSFEGWSGGCSGTGPCSVSMDQSQWIGARFSGPRQLLVRTMPMSEGAGGRVMITPAPLGGVAPYCDHPETCIFKYPPNTTVRLVAEAEPGSKFVGWQGSCSGLEPCEGTAGGTLVDASAMFLGPRALTVTVSSEMTGRGSVTVSPLPLSGSQVPCTNPGDTELVTCVYLYPPDTVVSLTSQTEPGSTFLGWGSACGGTNACQVQLATDPVTVQAGYQGSMPLMITLTSQGGWGTVTLNPPSADGLASCELPTGVAERTCAVLYAPGTLVSLIAQAAAGSAFAQWGGACTGSGSCEVLPGATVSAAFKVGAASPQAVYDTQLRAPKCAAGASACDSGALLVGRATLGPEPHYPNTVGTSCSDGTGGRFHSDESVDRIQVATLDGSALAPGKTVKVDVTIWAWSGYSSDKLDLYYARSATAPQWTFLRTLSPTKAGEQVLSTTYVLPSGSQQVLRARLRYGGSATGACVVGSYNDHDDLVFVY